MYHYTHIHENADKILRHYIENQQGMQRFQGSNLVTVIAGLTNLKQALDQLVNDGYLKTDGYHNDYYTITGVGTTFIKNGGYKAHFERLKQQDDEKKVTESKTARKLEVDLANAERVYKTYNSTRFISWTSFGIGLFLGFLKLAEVLKWWPYHK